MMHVLDELVEDALRELADDEAQARLWHASAGPEVSSFVECTARSSGALAAEASGNRWLCDTQACLDVSRST